MAGNRAQRRAAKRKGKRPGETYMDVLTQKQMIKKAVEDSVHDQSVALESDIKTQRLLWMCVVALNRAFGFAGVRSQRFMLTIDEVREELEKMAKKNGWEYAIEKLREAAAKITGMEVKQVHEEEMIRARKENEANGIFFPAEDPDKFSETDFAPLFEKKKGPEWNPVTERLPESIDSYLVAVKYKYEFEKEFSYDTDVATYNLYEGGYIDGCWDTWNDWDEGQEYLHITHWMPLPKYPEEAKA